LGSCRRRRQLPRQPPPKGHVLVGRRGFRLCSCRSVASLVPEGSLLCLSVVWCFLVRFLVVSAWLSRCRCGGSGQSAAFGACGVGLACPRGVPGVLRLCFLGFEIPAALSC
jgi:hypothetical protein